VKQVGFDTFYIADSLNKAKECYVVGVFGLRTGCAMRNIKH